MGKLWVEGVVVKIGIKTMIKNNNMVNKSLKLKKTKEKINLTTVTINNKRKIN